MALGKLFGASSPVDKILAAGDIDSPKAQAAVAKLQQNKTAAVQQIMDMLQSGPKINHSLLLKLLELLIDNSSIDIIMESMAQLDPQARQQVVSMVCKNQDFDPHLLLPHLKDSMPKQLGRDLIMAHRNSFTGFKLLRAIGKVSPELWETMFELIYGLADERILPEAIATSRSKNPVMRHYITQLIAEFNNPAASEALLHLAYDENDEVRRQAITGLTRHKADIPAKDLIHLLQNAQGQEIQFIKVLLRNCKDPELGKYLAKVLLSKNNDLITVIMDVLKDIVNERIIKDILLGMEGKDPWVKEDVIKTLSESGGERYLKAVGKLANDADESIRGIAMEALEQGDVTNPQVIEALRDSLNAEDYLARQNAIRRLGEAKDTGSIDRMIAIMKNDPQSCPAVLEALGNIGDSRALPDVFDLLNVNEIQIQRAALECLPKLINDNYAPGIRDKLFTQADKLHVAVGQTVIETIEAITANFGLPRDNAYNDALRHLVAQLSEDKEKLVEPETSALSSADPIMSLEASMTLGDRYELIREIGRGGYGAVWLVRDTIIDEELVMKFLHDSLVSDGIAVERFIRELRFARKVTHQNIIRLHDYLNFGNVSAISMEYFEGRPLSEIIHDGPLEPQRMVTLLGMLCNALTAAHEVEVIHRDLKPANILVNDDDNVKIVDFGIAAASKQAESKLTRTGTLVGTPTYISPEQIQGKQVDGRTDIYSLGIIMYEMLTGKPPYLADDPMALVFMHVEGNAKRIEEVNPLVPAELADIVHRCMAPQPEDRFQNMKELERAFAELNLD